jgi:hypothetical protein
MNTPDQSFEAVNFMVSPTNKTDPNDVTEILLKVVLNTIKPKTN